MRLINNLKAFNRKERFILLHKVLGFSDRSFRLGEAFRAELSECLEVDIPSDAFVAMDYHFDWLQMAMYLTANPRPRGLIRNSDNDLVAGNQEDIDLLIAFEKQARTHLVLVEAKGVTTWSNEQLQSKADRIQRIFAPGRPGRDSVEPYFVMMSPKESENETLRETREALADSNGSAIRTFWFPLPLPNGLVKPTRCDSKGKSNAEEHHIRLDIVSPTWLATHRIGRT